MKLGHIVAASCCALPLITMPLTVAHSEEHISHRNGCCDLKPEEALEHISNNHIDRKNGCCHLAPKDNRTYKNCSSKKEEPSDDIDEDIDI